MKTDICLNCKATRGDHVELAARLAEAMKAKGTDPAEAYLTINVSACDTFTLDRKATWHAERGNPPKRYCQLMTGCTTCGARGAVTYHKAHFLIGGRTVERLMHTGCPGPGAAPAPTPKHLTEAPR